MMRRLMGLSRWMAPFTILVLLAAWTEVVGTPSAHASTDLEFRWMEVLVRRVEPTFRELHVLDYRTGLTPTGFQVPGWVDLRQYKVGDHLLARVGVNNTLILEVRKVPPPAGDNRYQEALRRLEAEGEDRTP